MDYLSAPVHHNENPSGLSSHYEGVGVGEGD